MTQPATSAKPIVLAITGASGAIYAARLLESLLCLDVPVLLTISDSGVAVIRQEMKVDVGRLDGAGVDGFLEACDNALQITASQNINASEAVKKAASGYLRTYHYKDYFTPLASGSYLTAGMIVCPCSGSTLSGIAHAASQNLIQRAAEVHLKEHRRLILVPRETPLSTIQLENMHRISQAGAVVLPASPGWYHGVESLLDVVDFIVARILDQLGIENRQIQRWTETDNSQEDR